MRILVIHNRYQQPGGEDAVARNEVRMMAAHGHSVDLMLADNEYIRGAAGKLRAAATSFYSTITAALVTKRIRAFRPDLVHVHNFHATVSPSVFFATRREHVPVVHTLHNYRLICPAANLFREGVICTQCVNMHSFLPGAMHGCYRGSRVGTAVIGASNTLQGALGTWTSRVNAYIALSQFSADLLTRYRIPVDRVSIKPNFTGDPGVGEGNGGYALFVGRLVPEKGLGALIDAEATGQLKLPIVVLGDGPMRLELEVAAQRPGSMLRIMGAVSKDEVSSYMQRAQVVLVPSLWHEPFGLTVIEAFAAGCPVIGSTMGALPEIIPDGVAGYLVAPLDTSAFITAINHFSKETSETRRMRVAARQRFEALYSEDTNYQQLLAIYRKVFSSGAKA